MKCMRRCCCNCCCSSPCCRGRHKDCSDLARTTVLPPYSSVYFRRRRGKLSRPKQLLVNEKLTQLKASMGNELVDSEAEELQTDNDGEEVSINPSIASSCQRSLNRSSIGSDIVDLKVKRKVTLFGTDIDFQLKKKKVGLNIVVFFPFRIDVCVSQVN